MKSLNLVFDIDDTLMSLAPFTLEAMNTSTGLKLKLEDLKTFDLTKMYPVTTEEVFDALKLFRVLENSNWIGHKEKWNAAVLKWSAKGHSVVFCTARGWHPEGEKLTASAISQGGQIPHLLIVCKPGESKLQALRAANIEPHLIVDDNLDHIREFDDARVDTFLVTMPWNVDHEWHSRVSGQEEIIAVVNEYIADIEDFA